MKGGIVSFQKAVNLIKNGGVVAVPTETVYGLAGDIQNTKAIKQIFQIKKRPFFDPLIVHFSSKTDLKKLCQVKTLIPEKLSDFFHPGPLSLVLRKTSLVSDLITAGLNKVAVRMPNHSLTLKLIRETGCFLAAPSANLFSKISPTRAEHILESLSVPVLDGGSCVVGLESTVLEVIEEKKMLSILRPGAIGKTELSDFLNQKNLKGWTIQEKQSALSPGQSKNHYQPSSPLVMVCMTQNVQSKNDTENRIKKFYQKEKLVEIEIKKDPSIFARKLYHKLRVLSDKQTVIYIVKPLWAEGEAWQVIWNRVEKASSKIISV